MGKNLPLIPVIDLLDGQVVRAVRGQRAAYRPIVSALCASSEPLAVARALSAYCEADRLYVADLDALMGRSAQQAVLRALLDGLPGIALWLDAGFPDAASARRLLVALGPQSARVVPVFASESLTSREALATCFDPADAMGARAVLSLDRRDGRPLDAAGCWDAVDLWPPRVIAMTLERVGSADGPDLDTVRRLRALAPGSTLVGAGGVRDAADLSQAHAAGADAWLVASALHDLRLPRASR